MNVPATQRQLSPVENYTQQVIGDERHAADLWSALPSHVKPERFKRNLVNALMQNPKLMNHDPRLIFREVSKAAALGLLLDPQLGEAYIIESWAGGKPAPQLRTGYRGIMKLARQTQEIANIYPGEVREFDHFIAEEGTEKRLEHRPDYTKPRGKPVCYYAVVIYKDGTKDFEVMDMGSLDEIRDRSDAWKAFKAGKIKSTPWATDDGEMRKKTVLRRVLKRVPQSPELSDAIAMENAADFRNDRQAPPVRHLRPVEQPRTIEGRLNDFAAEPAGDYSPEYSEDDFAAIPSAAETPADPVPAGAPAASGISPVAGAAGSPDDPIEKALVAGREACRDGAPYDPVPREFAKYKNWASAWKEGYQAEGERMEVEMNQ